MSAPAAPAADWTRRTERGAMPLIRLMAWLSCTLGRGPTRIILRGIAVYFVIFGGRARRSSRHFLKRALGREPNLVDKYKLFFHFSTCLHDRVFFLRNQDWRFDIVRHGLELFEETQGALLMGAHLGSFEALRAAGRTRARRRVVMAMFEDNARKINRVLHAIAPDAMSDVVGLGRVQSMLELAENLEQGSLVGVLADRTLGDEPVMMVDFLGTPAPFPTGPMRMAAALRQPVIFMAALYRGGNKYEMYFELLADFSKLEGVSRAERSVLVENAVRAYAARLEHYARLSPYDWFNFFDFWALRK